MTKWTIFIVDIWNWQNYNTKNTLCIFPRSKDVDTTHTHVPRDWCTGKVTVYCWGYRCRYRKFSLASKLHQLLLFWLDVKRISQKDPNPVFSNIQIRLLSIVASNQWYSLLDWSQWYSVHTEIIDWRNQWFLTCFYLKIMKNHTHIKGSPSEKNQQNYDNIHGYII